MLCEDMSVDIPKYNMGDMCEWLLFISTGWKYEWGDRCHCSRDIFLYLSGHYFGYVGGHYTCVDPDGMEYNVSTLQSRHMHPPASNSSPSYSSHPFSRVPFAPRPAHHPHIRSHHQSTNPHLSQMHGSRIRHRPNPILQISLTHTMMAMVMAMVCGASGRKTKNQADRDIHTGSLVG